MENQPTHATIMAKLEGMCAQAQERHEDRLRHRKEQRAWNEAQENKMADMQASIDKATGAWNFFTVGMKAIVLLGAGIAFVAGLWSQFMNKVG